MSSNEVPQENIGGSPQTDSCKFCGCKISDEQVTMWHREKPIHTECYQINNTKENDQKEKGIGLIISKVKIIDSSPAELESQSKGAIPNISK